MAAFPSALLGDLKGPHTEQGKCLVSRGKDPIDNTSGGLSLFLFL